MPKNIDIVGIYGDLNYITIFSIEDILGKATYDRIAEKYDRSAKNV
jgi:hypothetical protein